MLDQVYPEYLAFPDLLKATAVEEGGRRYVYVEASNESVDHQNEVILAKALEASADYFLRYGNLDIDHITVVGAQRGIPNFSMFEIGRPVDVRPSRGQIFVKGQITQGEGPTAEAANIFWNSQTRQEPKQRWYPSVAGQITGRDPEKPSVVTGVRWTNIGFSKTPVNLTVAPVTIVPMAAFAKSWTAAGLDLSKALDSGGYATDSANMTGGGALARQSLDHHIQSYWDFRDRVAGDIRAKRVGQTAQKITDHMCARYGVSRSDAAEYTAKFLSDLGDDLQRKKAA